MRRYGPPPLPQVRYRTRPGAYAILPRGGRILCTFQHAPTPEVQLPGGGIDPGEHPAQALPREVREETGWTIGPARRLGAFRRFVFMPDYDIWAEKVCTVWLARPILRLGPPSEKGHDPVWLAPRQALARLADPGSRACLGAYLGAISTRTADMSSR